MSFIYFFLGACLVLGVQQSILVVLFRLEVLFFSFILTLFFTLGFIGLYFLLLLVVFSGVLGLCLFVGGTSSFNLESCSSFVD